MTPIPKFESPRAALNAYRADIVQVITNYERAVGKLLHPFHHDFVGPAIEALTAAVLAESPGLRERQARRFVLIANAWAPHGTIVLPLAAEAEAFVTPVTTRSGTSE